ncbi:MAG: hypothetical protein PUE00_01935, partial [Thermobifida fusca]|nr:hypothetical protein [Thermobifida fusca]
MTDTTSPALTGQPTNYPLGRLPVEIDPRRRAPEPDEVHHDALAPAPHRCPAAVATWSGWVEVGRMTGFGEVAPLPGIWDELVIEILGRRPPASAVGLAHPSRSSDIR